MSVSKPTNPKLLAFYKGCKLVGGTPKPTLSCPPGKPCYEGYDEGVNCDFLKTRIGLSVPFPGGLEGEDEIGVDSFAPSGKVTGASFRADGKAVVSDNGKDEMVIRIAKCTVALDKAQQIVYISCSEKPEAVKEPESK